MDRLVADAASGRWHEAAKAIMTTDTFAKGAAAVVRMGPSAVTICGIAKGAGMIAPDMATMLSFVFTDAPIAPAILKALLRDGVEQRPVHQQLARAVEEPGGKRHLLAIEYLLAPAPRERVSQGLQRRASQSRRAGGARRRRRAQAH